MIYVIFIVFALISFGVQKTLQNKFENYSKVPIPNGLTGKDMLNSSYKCNGIHINNLFKFFVWCEVSKSFTRSII